MEQRQILDEMQRSLGEFSRLQRRRTTDHRKAEEDDWLNFASSS